MSISVAQIHLNLLNVKTRMPFRYGIASMTAMPILFVRMEAEVDGKAAVGVAADCLPPKWFTKNPASPFRDDVAEMLEVIRSACGLARGAGKVGSVFELWRAVYEGQREVAKGKGWPPLLWNFGVSLVERAAIEALCRAEGFPLARALGENRLGVRLGEMRGELEGMEVRDVLPERPLRSIIARHTVGLADPLADRDIPGGERLDDGLPETLEESIRAYGLTHFKIKLCGDPARDLGRLQRLAGIIAREAPAGYGFTLDGNEQFQQIEPFQQLWRAIQADGHLAEFMQRLIFIEQPLHREVALSESTRAAMGRWRDRPVMIIDESDGDLAALPRALECGYAGTSHKNCKGIVKGLANAALLERRRSAQGGRFVLSGEDLSNIGPVGLLQDLAVMANLGIEHVERNGHHYFAGIGMFPREVQEGVLRCHGDLYGRHERGYAAVKIARGRVEVGSVVEAPFGVGFEMETRGFVPVEEWGFESLGLE